MGLDALNMGLDAANFGLQRLDARVELLDRQWIEVLPRQLGQRVFGLAREEVFHIHGQIVDPPAAQVNKPPP